MRYVRTMVTLLVAAAMLAGVASAEMASPNAPTPKATLPTVRIGDVRNPPAATYLVVCTEAAAEALAPLAARRAATGQTVHLATVESVAKAYADEPSQAKRIRQVIDNVRRASAEAKLPLGFVLIVGTFIEGRSARRRRSARTRGRREHRTGHGARSGCSRRPAARSGR